MTESVFVIVTSSGLCDRENVGVIVTSCGPDDTETVVRLSAVAGYFSVPQKVQTDPGAH